MESSFARPARGRPPRTETWIAKGLADVASGLNLTVRNPTTHSRVELSEQEGLERLAAYSYLARMLDECEVRQAKVTGADGR